VLIKVAALFTANNSHATQKALAGIAENVGPGGAVARPRKWGLRDTHTFVMNSNHKQRHAVI